jgi:hypothetical protein
MAFDFVFFLLGDEGDDDALDLMSAPPLPLSHLPRLLTCALGSTLF